MTSLSPALAPATASARSSRRYGLAQISQRFVGFLSTPSGLARMTLPQPARQGALDELRLEEAGDAGRDDAAFSALAARLQRYFAGLPETFDDVALDLSAVAPFHRRVLEMVRAIPRGAVRTYGEVAALAGSPRAARAVGAAMAANPICVIIPCHRVIGTGGRLTGFGGGLPLKRRLLEMEGAVGPELARSRRAATPMAR